ncbi:ALWAYS EARLY 3-like protein [Tanacetum coccineum]
MYKPEAFEISKFFDAVGTDKSGVHLPSFSHRTVKPKVFFLALLILVPTQLIENFTISVVYVLFYLQFAEYFYHVGLGHVPRLTRVEWGVIRRTHYTKLRSGSRDGLPTYLAKPLLVGKHVIAIYPKTREIHDGTVLTVDQDMCRVQFNQPKLGSVAWNGDDVLDILGLDSR